MTAHIGSLQREGYDAAWEERGCPPRNVEGRLREWSRGRWNPPPNLWQSESPLYAILKSPGRATDTSGDGGMANRMDRNGEAIARWTRILETGKAVKDLPPSLREVVEYVYDVPQRERPKSERSASDKFGITREETGKMLARAYGWLERELNIVTPRDVLNRGIRSTCG